MLWIFTGFAVSAQSLNSEKVAPTIFPKIKSSVLIPVQIPLAEISNIINASTPNLLFEDNSFTDNDNDQFKVKVWKTRPIRLVGGTEQNLLIEVPLKIWAEKGIGKFGLYNYQNTTFETVMYFSTQINFQNNWTVATKTSQRGFKWVTKPVLDYGKIKLPLTSLIESTLQKQQAEFSKTIDEMLAEQLNFQKYAVLAWNNFAQPFNISEEYDTWLKVSPLNINISPLVFYRDRLDFGIGIETYSETFTGEKPAASPLLKTVANFKKVPELPQKFVLQTTANIPLKEAEEIAEKMFLGKEFDFREGKSKIVVDDVKISSVENRIIMEISTSGALEGISTISGIPVYDAEKRKITLSETTYKLSTKNILHKAAALLFKGKIVHLIETEYGIPTATIEDEARKSIEEAFNKEYYKGVKLTGKVFGLKPSKILLNGEVLTVVIDTEAKLVLKISGF
ncbi:hypothetical protein OA84_04435 [Kaistella solincola]|uniref:DUF4403 family protein n=1 Tax=Kaistella solincola TaxID=510955 RepID=A0ABR4ZS08_9FLAO|nr:hypothetical protein OA84_04435 [Kaistella solincola]